MPVMLRNQDGYFSRTLDIGGSKFRIRDLTEDEVIEASLREQSAVALRQKAAGAKAQTREILKEAYDGFSAHVNYVIESGLVGWDLSGVDVCPETIAALPVPVRTSLVQAIIAESTFTRAEVDFSPPVFPAS